MDKSTLGAVVALEEAGKVTVTRGVLTAAQLQAMNDTRVGGASGVGADSRIGSGGDSGGGSGTKLRPEFAEKLLVNLTSHRTAAIQAGLLLNPGIALAALASRMAQAVLVEYRAAESAVKVNVTRCLSGIARNASDSPHRA